ncbi:MAG: hypothetical protein LBG76_02850 [Treponema sp.]|jgi:hypothetical protein|nr:hypothetical protein [Treponema sp.]
MNILSWGTFKRAFLFLPIFLCSCAEVKKIAEIPHYGLGGTTLYGFSKDAVMGKADLSGVDPARAKPLRYALEPPPVVPEDCSLELIYRFDAGFSASGGKRADAPVLTLEIGNDSWILPQDAPFPGFQASPAGISYAVPVAEGPLERFRLNFSAHSEAAPSESGGGQFPPGASLEITSFALIPRWYGFVSGGEDPVRLTPFVSSDNGAAANTIVIEPPARYRPVRAVELTLAGAGSRVEITGAAARIEHAFSADAPPWELRIPPALLSTLQWPLSISAETFPAALELSDSPTRPFPMEPIPADPGLVLSYPQDTWRDRRYEVFRWPRFPAILIFDTADYAVQERLFKRLAFFIEKAGYRGRLLTDKEMEGLHGWNAHDYRGEDLARFFEAARLSSFPLSPEERELEAVLLGSGILRQEGETLRAGEGAVVSISRESSAASRSLFMIHEGFHGIFFIDEDFNHFCRARWEKLNPQAKRFLLSFFDYQHYDIKDSYLVVNEFMAYCLQQPVSQAGWYFGEKIAAQIEASTWRYTVLPPKDEARGVWPLLARVFTEEAEALSDYVERRWGLAAGRINAADIH